MKHTLTYLTTVFIFLLPGGHCAYADSYLRHDYSSFAVWLDCDRGGTIAWMQEVSADQGNIVPESREFYIDPTVPLHCQMSKGSTFKKPRSPDGSYDRGHLVSANSVDSSEIAVRQSFYVTNMLPQSSRFNRYGAWRTTEKMVECYREVSPLTVFGGVIWGEDGSNDHFKKTHNIITPDYFWKLIYRHDTGAYIAWILPNRKTSTTEILDDNQVAIDVLKNTVPFLPDHKIIKELLLNNHGDIAPWDFKVVSKSTLRCEGVEASIQ